MKRIAFPVAVLGALLLGSPAGAIVVNIDNFEVTKNGIQYRN